MYYEHHLPHWHPEDPAIFLTWRLKGSRPRNVELVEATSGKAFAAVDRELGKAAMGPRWLADERIATCVRDTIFTLKRN